MVVSPMDLIKIRLQVRALDIFFYSGECNTKKETIDLGSTPLNG
jgi:hypothetical protein